MYPRVLSKLFNWVKAHGFCGREFVKGGEHIWVFIRCRDNSQFRQVYVAILDRFSSTLNEEVVVLGRIIDAIGPDVRVVSVQGGPHALVEAYVNFLGNGYQEKLIGYRLFDLRLFKRCLQRTASSVFETLDPYSKTVFIVNRLKGVESRDGMASRPALKKAIISSSLVMPELVDVVAIMVGMWPLFFSYLKETGRNVPAILLWYDLPLSISLPLFRTLVY